jgi:hypothetical protein
MKKFHCSLILAFITTISFSQTPWNAKVMLHSAITGDVDTVWIGCDENGGWGYQLGLDIIDTIFKPFAIWADDSVITSDCFNLQKDIKKFTSGYVHFNFQIVDSINQGFPYDYIKIDTNEFKFTNGDFQITSVYLQVLEGGYIEAIDVTDWYIYYGIDTSSQYLYFSLDSISLIYESIFLCLPINESQMRLRLNIGFNLYLPTNVISNYNSTTPSIFPNPTSGLLFIKNVSDYPSYEIFDMEGRILIEGFLKKGEAETQIHLDDFPKGAYTIKLNGDKSIIPDGIWQIIIL